MRDVVAFGSHAARSRMGPVATGGPIRVDLGEIEAALEKPPRHALGVQQIADVGTVQSRLVASRADVAVGLGVAGDGGSRHFVNWNRAGGYGVSIPGQNHTAGLPRYQVK